MPTTAYAESGAIRLDRDPTMGALPAGLVLNGTYRVGERLASGGMGEVYVATHERLPVRVAIKVLHRDSLGRPDAIDRFGREALIMAGLRHPHVTQIFEFNVTQDGTPYLVMELLEGVNLQTFLDQHQALAPGLVGAIVRQIGSALDAAHHQGVVHRDLKPENIMLLSLKGHETFVKVFDFGISKIPGGGRLTGDTAFMGTPEYMSPEQAQASAGVDHRTDQFALAAMTYALLSGRKPFDGDHPLGVLYQVVNHDPPPLASLVDWPAQEVDRVLRRGLAKRPEERFPDIWTFSCALADALVAADVDTGVHARPGRRPRPTPTVRRPRRRRTVAAAITTGVVSAGLCAAFVLSCGGYHPARAEALRLWRSLPSLLDEVAGGTPPLAAQGAFPAPAQAAAPTVPGAAPVSPPAAIAPAAPEEYGD
jgi:serine/threonine protein kinase